MNWTHGLFDEPARAGHEHLDARHVAGYDRKAGFDADAEEEVAMLRRLGLDERSTLVDLGAGTGTLALAAAATCKRVVAVDISSEMVAATKQKITALGVSNVECVQAGFLSYSHRGAPAEFVYSRNALHHLTDFWKAVALQAIALILQPGGILRLRDIAFAFEPHEAQHLIGEWLESARDRPDEGWTRAEFEEHLREENSTFSWLLEPMLVRAGFEIKEADYGARRVYAEYVCVKAG